MTTKPRRAYQPTPEEIEQAHRDASDALREFDALGLVNRPSDHDMQACRDAAGPGLWER